MMKLIPVGDTTYASDPTKSHKSYTVYTTENGKREYTRVLGKWHYAHQERIGYRVGRRVPKNVASRLGG